MTIQIALGEATNDLIMLEGGGIARVKDGRFTIQLVKNKLLTVLGEWVLDTRVGWLAYSDYERNPDLFSMEMRAREIILATVGVQKFDSINLELTNRVLYLTFTATTIYGGIELTVPWSI